MLAVRGFRRWRAGERAAITTEGVALLGFLYPGREPDVRVG